MPDRDGYIPGVPCWVDTSQPDPEAAAEFYGGLFGWEFEDVMPAGVARPVLHRRGCAAATSRRSAPARGRAADRRLEHLRLGRQRRRRPPRKVREAGGTVLMEPFDVMDAGRMAVFADPRGRRRSASGRPGPAPRRAGRQRARQRQLQRPPHPRRRGREGVLRRRVRLGDARHAATSRCGRCRGYGDHLEELNPGTRERMAEMGAPGGFEDVVASLGRTDDRRRHAVALGRDVRGRRRRRHRAKRAAELGGEVLVPPFDAPWVRHDGHPRPAGRDVHRQPVRAREQRAALRRGGDRRLGDQRTLGRRGQPLDHRVERQAAAGIEEVEALEAGDDPEDVVGLLDAHPGP